MTREQILHIVRAAPSVGKVTHEEFVDYVVALTQRKRTEDGWQNVEHPYMTVDGKLAMANQDHIRQGKRLTFEPPQVLVDNEDQLTLMVMATSELYGTRHGIATSRRVQGTPAEREFPWEVAETSAIGRALSAMGYGLFPGSGMSSAEDLLRTSASTDSQTAETTRAETRGSQNGQRTQTVVGRKQSGLSMVQKSKLIELYRHLHGGTDEDALAGLENLFVSSYKHGLAEASYEEGARTTGQLINQLKAVQQ